MPYTKSPRPYKHEYEKQKARGELADRMERHAGNFIRMSNDRKQTLHVGRHRSQAVLSSAGTYALP